MHRRLVLTLLLLVSATVAGAAPLQFGPPLTAADLPAGEADASTNVVSGWAQNGEAEVIAMRHAHTQWNTTRMRVRKDGTADPNRLQLSLSTTPSPPRRWATA